MPAFFRPKFDEFRLRFQSTLGRQMGTRCLPNRMFGGPADAAVLALLPHFCPACPVCSCISPVQLYFSTASVLGFPPFLSCLPPTRNLEPADRRQNRKAPPRAAQGSPATGRLHNPRIPNGPAKQHNPPKRRLKLQKPTEP